MALELHKDNQSVGTHACLVGNLAQQAWPGCTPEIVLCGAHFDLSLLVPKHPTVENTEHDLNSLVRAESVSQQEQIELSERFNWKNLTESLLR